MQSTSRIRGCWIACLLALVWLVGRTSIIAAEPAGWKAGTAQVVITPSQPMWMAGYAARNRPSEGRLADLRAKALVLEDAAGHLAILVTLDLVGIDRELMQSICSDVAEKHGIQRDQIALCVTHTHTGPVLLGNLSPMHYRLLDGQQQQRISEYTSAERVTIRELRFYGVACTSGPIVRPAERKRHPRARGTLVRAENRPLV